MENGNLHINKTDLFAGMIANAWYTINYFKLSYGKQDKLKVRMQEIIKTEKLNIDEKKYNILNVLKSTKNKNTLKSLRYFDGEVPYRFLSPWFNDIKGDKKEIYQLSQSFHNNNDISNSLLLLRFYLNSTLFLTNNFTWKAKTVADIYKERWHIEVFFKQIKQHMKIKSFVGTSENAVQIQIWAATTAIPADEVLKRKGKI